MLAGAQQHLAEDVTLAAGASPDDQTKHAKDQAQASLILEQAIYPEVATLLGPTCHTDTPHALLNRIEAELIKNNRATRKQLESEAKSIIYTDNTTIEQYVLDHIAMRNRMITAKCADIENQETTVEFILNGISAHPDYAPCMKTLIMSPPGTTDLALTQLQKARSEIAKETASLASQPPARRHNLGRGRQNRGRAAPQHNPQHPWRARYNGVEGRNQPRPQGYQGPWCAYHGSRTHDNSGCNTQLRKIAEAAQARQAQQPPQVEDQINEDSECILDSAAYPSHTNEPTSTMTRMQSTHHTKIANGQKLQITHEGPTAIRHAGNIPLQMPRMIVVPSFPSKLLSVSQICKKSDALFQEKKAHIMPKGRPPTHPTAAATAKNGMRSLDMKKIQRASIARSPTKPPTARPDVKPPLQKGNTPHITTLHSKHQPPATATTTQHATTTPLPKPTEPPNHSKTAQQCHEWRLKMAHLPPRALQRMARSNLVTGLPDELKNTPPQITCSACAQGKQPQSPLHRNPTTQKRGDMLVSDACGKISPVSTQMSRCFVTCIEVSARKSIIRFIKQKSDAARATKEVINLANNQLQANIRAFTADNAKERYSAAMKEFYQSKGILPAPTTPHTPQEIPSQKG